MSLARRHRSSAPAMRGRRPLLSGLLGWVALLALLFGSGAALFPGSAIATAATAQEHPAGGETAPEEETPAKPQRLVGTRVAEASGARTALPALLAWIDLHWQAAPVHFSTAPANITDPWPAVPGRRVQRGQAPPRA